MFLTLCVLDRASSWYLNRVRPTWCHLFYYVNLLLNMFRVLIHPSSGACDYLVCYCIGCIVLAWGVFVLCSRLTLGDVVSECRLYHYYHSGGSTCTRISHHQQSICYTTPTRLKPAQYKICNNTPSSRKLLKMGVLTPETCWAVNWHNKISDIKLVYIYSNVFNVHRATITQQNVNMFH